MASSPTQHPHNFRLTCSGRFVFFVRITEDQLQFSPDMKKLFVLSMLISFAMVSSCQKQDLAAEQQLAQRKAELDARETALDEREKALAEREKATANIRRIPADVQGGIPDSSQVKAERDRRLQQLPAEVQALIADPSRGDAGKDEKDTRIQERVSQRQSKLGALQKAGMSRAVASPGPEDTSPSPSSTPQ